MFVCACIMIFLCTSICFMSHPTINHLHVTHLILLIGTRCVFKNTEQLVTCVASLTRYFSYVWTLIYDLTFFSPFVCFSRLYTSPKRPSPSQKNVSPYKWVRQEFEEPSPEVETAKKSLLFKLEEVAYRGK